MNKKILVKIIFIVLLIAGITLALYFKDHIDVTELRGSIANLGILAPIICMILYATATVLFFPGSVF